MLFLGGETGWSSVLGLDSILCCHLYWMTMEKTLFTGGKGSIKALECE